MYVKVNADKRSSGALPYRAEFISCVTGLPARSEYRSCRLFFLRRQDVAPQHIPRSPYRMPAGVVMKRLLVQAVLGLLIGILTVAGYAQWSNPADEVPAYNSQPPAKGTKLPPLLSGNQLTGPNFQY